MLPQDTEIKPEPSLIPSLDTFSHPVDASKEDALSMLGADESCNAGLSDTKDVINPNVAGGVGDVVMDDSETEAARLLSEIANHVPAQFQNLQSLASNNIASKGIECSCLVLLFIYSTLNIETNLELAKIV